MYSYTMTVPALGRPYTLGMLYDARHDNLIPGVTLWDKAILRENMIETPLPSSEFQVTASDSIGAKSSLMEFDASLKANFMCGLVDLGGSAMYLNDQKKCKNQSRVTFHYKATTHFQQLLMTDLEKKDMQQIDVIGQDIATHVVTGIKYGANAFFVFDKENLDAKSVQDIQGKMYAVIRKIPSLDHEGHIEIKLTDDEKFLSNTLSCKFYGDIRLNRNPATFVDAVKTYVEFPKLLGENKENVVPLKVWLMPLGEILSMVYGNIKETKFFVINSGLVMKAEETLEGFRELEMRCNDSLEDRLANCFPVIQETLSSFQTMCSYYISGFKKTMAKILPSIRQNGEEEELKKLFEDKDKSPFSQEKLSTWLDHKEREINIIKSCVDLIKEGTNTKIIPNQSVLDREVLVPGLEDALCFVFTSLGVSDPCLDAMTNFFESHKTESTNEDHWYFSDEVVTNMRDKAKAFHDLAKALKSSSSVSFLVTAKANEKYKGATIYHYNEGKLVTEDFSKPDVPPVETITDKKALMWYACDLSLDPNTANIYLILSDDNKKVTRGAKQDYPDHPERFDKTPQVLCQEKLTGRHYWEVDWGDGCTNNRAVGVAYKNINRKGYFLKGYLGSTNHSWCIRLIDKTHDLQVLHNAQGSPIQIPSSGCKQVGVYLDWPAGTLSFYNVSSNTLSHLYTINHRFTQPVYTGCFIHSKSGSMLFSLFSKNSDILNLDVS